MDTERLEALLATAIFKQDLLDMTGDLWAEGRRNGRVTPGSLRSRLAGLGIANGGNWSLVGGILGFVADETDWNRVLARLDARFGYSDGAGG